MKRVIIFLGILLLSPLVFAVTPGFYVGGDVGYSRLETPEGYAFLPSGANATTTKDRGGVGGMLVSGYNINQYIGVQVGYLRTANSEYKASQNGQDASLKYEGNFFKLSGTFNLPLKYNFEVFAELGIAYMLQRVTYNNPANIPMDPRYFKKPRPGTSTCRDAQALLGAGAAYHITDNWAVNMVWNMVNNPDYFNSDQTTVAGFQFVGVGVVYSI